MKNTYIIIFIVNAQARVKVAEFEVFAGASHPRTPQIRVFFHPKVE